MYALVFLVCFGVLHVFKKITTAGDSTEYTSKAAAETNIVIDGSADDTDRENGKMDGLKDQICQKIQMNYGMRRRKIPISDGKQAIKAGVRHCLRFGRSPEEEHYTPPRIIQATDVHYQSADSEDDGAAFQLFVERCDGKVVKYLPQLLDAFMESGDR